MLAQHSGLSVCDAAIDRSGRPTGRHLPNKGSTLPLTIRSPVIFTVTKTSIKDEPGTIIENVKGGSILNKTPWQGRVNTCSVMNVEPLRLSLPSVKERTSVPGLINARLLPNWRRLLVQRVTQTQKTRGGWIIILFFAPSNKY